MRLESGNVVAAKMNAHRHQWNGTICSQPQSWNCGADATFRANVCDAGVPRCFHLDVFRPNSPRFFVPDTSVVLAVQQQPSLLDDQVLVFYGGRFGMQQGIAPGDYEPTLFGFYRVKHANLDTARTPYRLVVEPHADGWAMFPRTNLRPAALRPIQGVAYLKQMRAKGLKDSISEALEAAESLPTSDAWGSDFQKRLLRARDALPDWLQRAEETLARLPPPTEAPRVSASFGNLEGPLAAKLKGFRIAPAAPSAPSAGPAAMPDAQPPSPAVLQQAPGAMPAVELADPVPEPREVASAQAAEAKPVAEKPVVAPATPDSTEANPIAPEPAVVEGAPIPVITPDAPTIEVSPTATSTLGLTEGLPLDVVAEAPPVHAVPEPLGRQVLVEQFGSDLVDALSVAFITKSLVILTGAPGAGKSWIASRLLDDTARRSGRFYVARPGRPSGLCEPHQRVFRSNGVHPLSVRRAGGMGGG
jgi:hypothetical protein